MTATLEGQFDSEGGRSRPPAAARPGLDRARTSSMGPLRPPARRRGSPRGSAAGLLAGALVALGVLLGLASPALAGVAVTATPDPPRAIAVGQTGVPSTVTVVNASNGAQAATNLTLEQITFVPSCGTQAIVGGDCPAGALVPGVLGLSATVAGQSGTACAGTKFTASLVDAAAGKYELTPSAPVVLGPVGSQTSTCVIDFTVAVLAVPALDANLGVAGLQTDQVASVLAVAADGTHAGGFASSELTIDPGTWVAPPPAPVAPAPAAPPAGAAPGGPSAPAAVTAAAPVAASTAGAATTAASGPAAAPRKRPARAHPSRRHHHKAARHAKVSHRRTR